MIRFSRLLSISLSAIALVTVTVSPAFSQQSPLSGRPQPASRNEERVVAEVNDQAISSSDLYGRLQLALVSSGFPDNPETRQRLLPQVLRLLIDEKLQLQEATKLEIRITDAEIDAELQEIAKNNRLTQEQFQQALAGAGVPLAIMRDQIRANIAWSKLVRRRLMPTVQVGDEEVQAYADRIKANAGKPEYLVSEIFLAVDKQETEGEILTLANRLVEQIGAGASFGAVAQQFSQSAGAATGGDLGWVQQGQLEPALDGSVQRLQAGQFSRPIRGSAGYHILWLRDQRSVTAGNPDDIQVAIGQLVVAIPEGGNSEAVSSVVGRAVEKVNSCDALQQASTALPGASTAAIPLTRIGDIPKAVSQVVARLAVGQPSQPLITDVGVMVLMVCNRQVPEGSLPPLDMIEGTLRQEKLEMVQRRYLRDLRRDAFVDTRI